MSCPDNYDAFERHEVNAEKAYKRWISRLPECCECGKKIKDDDCYKIGDDLFHIDCIEDMKVHTNDYIEE